MKKSVSIPAEYVEEVYDQLVSLGYEVHSDAVNIALRNWYKNKKWIIDKMKSHPFYNGKMQIVFPIEYTREISLNKVKEFITWCSAQLCKMKQKDAAKQFEEVFLENIKSSFVDKEMKEIINTAYPKARVNVGMKMSRAVRRVCTMLGIDKVESFDKVIISNDYEENEVIDFAHFPEFADAVNEHRFVRWTVISVHPIDYLFMSHGSSWSSCQNIDLYERGNWINDKAQYFSGGTVSYMLDNSSIVLYTVDKEYEGDEMELQPKKQRNLFHVSDDRIIQGRVYPQSDDGGTDISLQFRNIFQKIWAECNEVSNNWRNVQGTEECGINSDTQGCHYADYLNFSECNVSYLIRKGQKNFPKKNEEEKNLPENSAEQKLLEKSEELINISEESEKQKTFPKIKIGQRKICMCCGKKEGKEERRNNILCEKCGRTYMKCMNCGAGDYEDNGIIIEDEWYCEWCTVTCNLCEETVFVGNAIDIGMNYYCKECYEGSSEIQECGGCGRKFDAREWTKTTEHGMNFCSDECADKCGYLYIYETDSWENKNNLECCESCNTYCQKKDTVILQDGTILCRECDMMYYLECMEVARYGA